MKSAELTKKFKERMSYLDRFNEKPVPFKESGNSVQIVEGVYVLKDVAVLSPDLFFQVLKEVDVPEIERFVAGKSKN